jgi:hypothetical protein
MMMSGLTIASSSAAPSMLSIIERLRSVWPSSEPGVPPATMRWKWSETPWGAIAIISVSTVGFPGGSRKPSLALQPIIAYLVLACSDLADESDPVRPSCVAHKATTLIGLISSRSLKIATSLINMATKAIG